ncbi:hypothetical protein NIES22_12730 [Calothrix brevissima NIES-22]|nr:hypothetical protein NIES22_12730 [Calothrix brevissima NIES-22]
MYPTLTKRSHFVKIAMIVLFSLGSLGVVGGSFLLKKAFSSSNFPEIVTDTSRYVAIHNELIAHGYQVKHFPNKIPQDAQDVDIAYSPDVLKGGSFFQLRLKESPEKIKQLLSQYKSVAKYEYRGGNTNDHANQPNGVPTTFFYTSKTSVDSFPPSYEILVLDAQDQGKPGFKWNHGYSYGVAIDSSTSDIVYWSEQW